MGDLYTGQQVHWKTTRGAWRQGSVFATSAGHALVMPDRTQHLYKVRKASIRPRHGVAESLTTVHGDDA